MATSIFTLVVDAKGECRMVDNKCEGNIWTHGNAEAVLVFVFLLQRVTCQFSDLPRSHSIAQVESLSRCLLLFVVSVDLAVFILGCCYMLCGRENPTDPIPNPGDHDI